MKPLKYFLGIIVLLWSCNKEDNPVKSDEVNNQELFPIKVGNNWEYTDTMYTENGEFLYTETSKLGITGSEEINYMGSKVKVYFWNWYNMNTNQPRNEKWLVAVENSSLYFYGGRYFDEDFIYLKSLHFKYPVSVNESWQTRIYSSNSSDSTFEYVGDLSIDCISTSEKLKTPYGELVCVVYHYETISSYGAADAYCYYSKGIGYVGLIVKTNGIVTYKKLLKSKSLSKNQFNSGQKISDSKQSSERILFDGTKRK